MICAYGFLSTLRDFFDICISNFWGEFVKFLSTWGRMLPRGRFSGHAVTAILQGLAGVLGQGYIRTRLGVAGLYSGPIWGLQWTQKMPRLSAGRGLCFIYCALLFGIQPPRQGVVQRLFQRCGRAFCLPL